MTAWLGVLLFAVQGYFLQWAFRGLRRVAADRPPENPSLRKFSVIIAAHNEADLLPDCLAPLIAQDYPPGHYEIILAADRCSDDTVAIARAFQEKFPGLKILEIDAVPPGISPKKHALARAIERAQFDCFLFLDADVQPTPAHLRAMNRHFDGDTAAVVSLMRFVPPQHFWQRFLVYEKLVSWCIAAAGIGWGRPVISYGGNWGYTRAAFQSVGGFAAIFHALSGDDDLLLQQMGAQNLPVRLNLAPQGWVTMGFPDTFRDFLRQRRRHFSAGKNYRPRLQVGYFLFHASNLLLWVAAAFSIPALLLLGLRLTLGVGLIRYGGRLFRIRLPAAAAPLFDLLYLLYNTLIGPLGHIGKVKW